MLLWRVRVVVAALALALAADAARPEAPPHWQLDLLERRVAQLEAALPRLEQQCVAADAGGAAPRESAQALVEQAMGLMARGEEAVGVPLLRRALALEPSNLAARIHLGLHLSHASSATLLHEGLALLEKTFAPDAVPQPLDERSLQGIAMLTILGRAYDQIGDADAAEKWLARAASSPASTDCARVMYGTQLNYFPSCKESADASVARFHRVLDELLARPGPLDLRQGIPPDANPFSTCFSGGFSHSFFYDSDARASLSKYMRVVAKGIPELVYTAPHLRPEPAPPAAVSGRVRLGILSAFLGPKSSVMLDFRGVLERIPRDRFEVTVVHCHGEKNPAGGSLGGGGAPWPGRPGDHLLSVSASDPDWLNVARAKLAALKLDLLLFLESTMSNMVTQLSLSRLARVQAVSHGHPMTTGVDKSVMHYFISWAAAELPSAAEHYTEELALLPADSVHQWYEPRVQQHGVSDVTGQPFLDIERAAFAAHVPADGHWYVCMQTPFKRQPEFDPILAAILRRDPHARLLLTGPSYKPDEKTAERVHAERLLRAGADMSRVHFVPIQPHHRLMALYKLADVVIDSYPASGCTTTREALEAGALIVSLPAKYLGSRWTLGIYGVIGVGVRELVAEGPADYVAKAVRVATDRAWAEQLRRRVRDHLPRLWRQQSAVDNWVDLLVRLSRAPLPT